MQYLYRAAAWTAITIATVLTASGVAERISTGVLVGLAAVAIQFTGDTMSDRVALAAVVVATVAGLTATAVAPSGLAEVPVFFAASRIRLPLNRGWGRWFVAADAIAVGVVIGVASHSLVGVLAGLGVPLLAQRAIERREVIAARDEAQALLVQVQAGREAEAEAAALQERGRIAGELHDVLAHSLAGLSVQLQATKAVAVRDDVGPAVLEPLEKAAMLARDGLSEARAVVGALRDPVGLDLSALPALVERQPGEVALVTEGVTRVISPEVGHAVYRAVQESLTNAARYAPGAAVTVTLSYASDELRVVVADSGYSRGRPPVPSQGTGLGLAGMDERLRGVAGSVTAGPREDGGWEVRMAVPA